ncbi:MAG: gas vesicle protein GvpD P-loop domain-containing protein [Nitrososphaerales archaeon]
MGELSKNNIPKELINFLSQESNILLIKGKPGTGKTVLSLELLNHFKESRNGVYLSTRVTPERLFASHSWLKDAIKPENVLLVNKKGITIMDAKIGMHSLPFERVYDLITKLNNPLIIVDSWEGIIKEVGSEEAEKMLELLENLISKKNANIVLVSENPDLSSLDYLVDGVVTLSDIDVFGEAKEGTIWSGLLERRPAREITINKLRGIERKRKNYAFTLYEQHFKYFPPLKPIYLEKFKAIPDPSKDRISSGIPDLDKILGGGYKLSTSTMFTLEHGVGNEHLHLLIFPLMINTLLLGRGLIITPLEGLGVEEHINSFQEIVGDKVNNVMIAQKAIYERPIPENRFFVHLKNLDKTLESWFAVRSKIAGRAKQPICHIMSTDFIEYSLGYSKTLLNVAMNISSIKEWGDVYISITKRGQKVVDQVSQMCDSHFVLKNIDGAIFIYGVRPETPLYNISVTNEEVKLIPLV